MGWFSSKDNTISDKDYKRLQDRAHREQGRRGGMFTREAINQRKKSDRQRQRSRWS